MGNTLPMKLFQVVTTDGSETILAARMTVENSGELVAKEETHPPVHNFFAGTIFFHKNLKTCAPGYWLSYAEMP